MTKAIKNVSKYLVFISFLSASVFYAVPALAVTPTLNITSTGNGDQVQINVYGDPNAGVYLYFQRNYGGNQSQYLGTTNNSGYLSTSVSTSSYGIVPGSSVYITVNNQQSYSATWPYNSGYYGGGSISFSQSNVNLSIGQTQLVNIYGGSAPYTQSSSNSNAFQSVISGNTITLIGQTTGSGTLTVCSSGNAGCANLYISVNSGYNYTPTPYPYQQISFSQNNLSLNIGNTVNVTIYGSGNYYISNNTNSNVASAYISGNTVVVTANNYGSDNITICQNYGQCGTLYVNVNYGNYYTPTPTPYPTIIFSQNNPSLNVGQSMDIYISGGNSSSYYVAYNSNQGALSASLTGTRLTINGIYPSNAVVVVCSTSTNCAALNVAVGQYGGGYQNWTYCASENQFCYFSGTRQVRYGMNGAFYYRTFTNGVQCTNSVFGDPIFGVVKQCSYQ